MNKPFLFLSKLNSNPIFNLWQIFQGKYKVLPVTEGYDQTGNSESEEDF